MNSFLIILVERSVMFRSQDNFLYFEKKGFGIGRVWKDVSDISFAGQRAMAWAASRTHLSQVPDQHTMWLLWRHLEQCVCRSFKF